MIRIAAAALIAALLAGSGLAPARAQTATPASPNTTTGTGTTSGTPSKSYRRHTTSSASTARGTPSGQGQFATEAEAQRSCRSDTVVWANPSSKTLHLSGDRYYGKTKRGAYMCEKQAMQDGYHIAGHGAARAKKTKASSQ